MSPVRPGNANAAISEVTRVLTSAACGAVVAAALAFFTPWQVSVLSGWIVASSIYVIWVWRRIHLLSGAQTAAGATREDASRASAHAIVLVSSVVSLAGVGLTLARASRTSGGMRVLLTILAILTVITAWTLVHMVFTLRYAHAYYGAPVGGIDFNTHEESPSYHDFAYLAYTIGMTFQVADTNLTSSAMRRLTLRHALLSYLFGAVILATMINITASFIL